MSGKRMQEFVDELGSKNEKRRRRAARFLRDSLFDERKKGAAMEALVNAFRIKNDLVSHHVIPILEKASSDGADVSKAVPVLALVSSYSDAAAAASRTLANACVNEKSRDAALAGLINAIESGSSGSREYAAWALWNAATRGVDVSAAVPALARYVGEDNRLRVSCRQILEEEAKNGKNAALSAFIRELGGNSEGIRHRRALGFLEGAIARDPANLKLISKIAREAKKEGKYGPSFAVLYSLLVKKLDEQANAIINDKSFHVPKVRKPNGMERVLRVKRSA